MNFYDVHVPRYLNFVNVSGDQSRSELFQLWYNIFIDKLTKNESGDWELSYEVIAENALDDPSFLRALALNSFRAQSHRLRLDSVIEYIDEMTAQVAIELEAR